MKLSSGPKMVRSDWSIEDKFSVGHFDFKMSKNSTLGLLEGPNITLKTSPRMTKAYGDGMMSTVMGGL